MSQTINKRRNWSTYNQSLVHRGDITLWFDEESRANWYSPRNPFKLGRPYKYSDTAIETLLTLRSIFHMTLRSVEGFSRSLMTLLGFVELSTPDYTSLCKRAKDLDLRIKTYGANEKLNILIDSTGVKVFGEGEWKVRMHGASKRRVWRKIHIAKDADTGQIYCAMMTQHTADDASDAVAMIKSIKEPIAKIYADGAYDKKKYMKLLQNIAYARRFLLVAMRDFHMTDPLVVRRVNETMRLNFHGVVN